MIEHPLETGNPKRRTHDPGPNAEVEEAGRPRCISIQLGQRLDEVILEQVEIAQAIDQNGLVVKVCPKWGGHQASWCGHFIGLLVVGPVAQIG